MSDVRVGQVWIDNDKRSGNREIHIVRIEGNFAIGRVGRLAQRQTRIRLDRFKDTSTGYRLKERPGPTPKEGGAL